MWGTRDWLRVFFLVAVGRLVPLGLTGDQVAEEVVTVAGVDVRLVRYVGRLFSLHAAAGSGGRGGVSVAQGGRSFPAGGAFVGGARRSPS